MKTAAWVRWLHLYVSMASFALVFFFAITGLTLNHAAWFDSGRQQTRRIESKLDPAWILPAQGTNVARLEIVEHLRRAHRISGALSDFRVEESQCSVSFKGPGYAADIFIERPDGRYELSETRQGWVAILNDLHKGRDTGRVWSLVIDLSAIFMVLVSLTGAALLLFLKRRRTSGFWITFVGALISVAAYLLFVP